MGFNNEQDVKIVLLNIGEEPELEYSALTFVSDDARDMSEFRDKEFDVIFSNSVIEHVGSYDAQRRMAQEVMRVGERYFVQTPNRFFPIEPTFSSLFSSSSPGSSNCSSCDAFLWVGTVVPPTNRK